MVHTIRGKNLGCKSPQSGVVSLSTRRRCGMNLIKALIGLLFLAVTSSGLAIGDDTSGATTYSVLEGNWVIKTDAPIAGGYGEAVVSTATNIYVARCLYASSDPEFWCYDPDVESWEMMNTSCLSTGAFRNGAAMTWDYDDHIYALFGGRYGDGNRTLFYRYSLSNDRWERLADTPNGQGAGDAITWSGYDGHVYAMIGSNARKTVFARCSQDSWETLAFNPNWTFTDDGASLVWTGGEYLYALRGEYDEHIPNSDFADTTFLRTSGRIWAIYPRAMALGTALPCSGSVTGWTSTAIVFSPLVVAV